MANMDIKKFAYRPMHQKLYESSEILDEKIEEVISLVQEYHKISPNEIGDPSTSSQSEIVAVGRIASDALEGKFNAASVVLESCRRVGAGSRVALKLDEVRSFSLFPGQVVALRGINPGGKYFVVKEILEVPTFPVAVTPAKTLEVGASRLSAGGLNLMIASGPYTTDDNLLFESLEEICNKAVEERPDIVILLGPFIDLEHPLVADGDFELDNEDSENGGTLEGLFRERIGPKIKMINKSMVIMLPSTKDAVSKHVSYPQEHFSRRILDLPKVRTANILTTKKSYIFS